MDLIATILWYSVFLTPLLTFPLIWKYSAQSKPAKILIALLLAAGLSFFLFFICVLIAFD